MRKRESWVKISGARVPKVHFLVWRDHCGRLASCHLKGSPPTPATTREKQESWGHMGNMLAIAQAGECLVSQRPFWCWKPFQGERRESEAHTKTCQCTICNNNFQKARSLNVIKWSTAKNNLVPQGQRNRPHWSKRTVKIKFVPQGQSDRPRQSSALQKINYYLEVNKIDYTIRRSQKRKFASRSPKSTSTRRALQKINLPQGHRNRPP